MALDAAFRERILRLSAEEKAEVQRLLDEHGATTDSAMGRWLAEAQELQDTYARDGIEIDAVAEVRAARDEIAA